MVGSGGHRNDSATGCAIPVGVRPPRWRRNLGRSWTIAARSNYRMQEVER